MRPTDGRERMTRQPQFFVSPFKSDSDIAVERGTCGIYAVVDLRRQYVYIGSSTNVAGRLRGHLGSLARNRHHCAYLQRAWNKDGEGRQFGYTVLEDGIPRERLAEREQVWLDMWPWLYNTNPFAGRPPSQAGRTMSPENRAKQSERFRAIRRTEKWRRRIGDAHRGKLLGAEQLKSMRERMKWHARLKTGAHSPEVRARVGAKLRGRRRQPFSEATKARMRASARARAVREGRGVEQAG